MKDRYLLMAVFATFSIGITFGLWVENLYAGVFAAAITYNIFVLKYY